MIDTITMDTVTVIQECKAKSIAGTITFPEVVARLKEVGIERYHVDLTRDETTYYLANGESHSYTLHGPRERIAEPFDAIAVEEAVRASQRGDIIFPEFLRQIMAAGCVGYFTQITGACVQYVSRTGDMHVEPFRATK